jgi:hypothetical protein
VRRSGPARKLTATERAERFPRRLTEEQARAARVGRMLNVLDQAWWALNPGTHICFAGESQLVLVSTFAEKDWNELAEQADPDKEDVEPPSAETCRGVVDIIKQRVSDMVASRAAAQRVANDVVCSSCGHANCHNVNCAEDCGIRNKPRETVLQAAQREIVSDRDAALREVPR